MSVCPYQFSGWEEITEQKQWAVLYDQALIGETKKLFCTVCDIDKTSIKKKRSQIADGKECAVFMKGLVSISLILFS